MHVPCSRLGSECFVLLLQHVVSCLAVVLLPICSTLGGGFNPEYEKARLHGPDGTIYPRLRIARGWQRFHKTNGHRITVEEDRVLVYRGHDTEGPPHVLSVRGQCVRWLGAAKGIAFFVVEDTSGYAKTPRQPHALHPDVLTIADLSVDEEVLRVVMKQLVKGGKETAIEFKRPALSSEIEE